ncbi:MAG: hypothetical protein K0U41_07810 [Gammaproteobacteria bacterium]|nr:hypothetical protein [Gammaproteobacteria bacterium]
MIKKLITWVLSLWIAFVFVQSLFFKFTNSPETQYIFGTIAAWMNTTFLYPFSELFAYNGGYVIGGFELIASLLLIIPGLTRSLGALLAVALMTGAIFFHTFTPLGINVQGDGGVLFYMACSVWVSGLIIVYLQQSMSRRRYY